MFALSFFGDITPWDRLRRWIDVASGRHVLARLDAQGVPLGEPVPITEDRDGYDTLLRLLGPPPVLVAMEATGHYWKNLHAMLAAAGHHVALLNPLKTRRFQDSGLERIKTDAIDAAGIARFAFEKRPEPTRLHDEAAEALREFVRHRDRIRQDFDDRVRQLHRLMDLGFPEFTRYVRGLDSMLATCLLAECPTAHEFAQATPRRLAKLRHDGRHLVGAELAQLSADMESPPVLPQGGMSPGVPMSAVLLLAPGTTRTGLKQLGPAAPP